MAYVDYDFQSDAIGTHLPIGPFVAGFVLADEIVAGGPSGTDRSFELVGQAVYTHTGYLASFTHFIAVRQISPGPILSYVNGPNGLGQFNSLMRINMEQDGTVTARDGGGLALANSISKYFNFYAWNFFQVNVTFSDAINLGTGLLSVRIQCEVALNGTSILLFDVVTAQTVAPLANGTAEVNTFIMESSTRTDYGAYTLDTLQAIVSYPHPGTPVCLVNQGVVEIETLPDTAVIQVQQGVIEIQNLPDTAKVLVFQGVIELILGLGTCIISES